ncbi:MAG: flagellar hook-basal body complex protein [Chloroflexota bacterium]
MGGSGALFDGVSGLDNHQAWMNVIGNNIANVNTAGFKDSQFNFQDVIYQTLKGASSAATGGPGGTDFEQSGLGVNTGSIMTNEQQGSLQTTNLPTDFAIQGDGFFVVNNGASNFYTRDSNFIVDAFGNINQSATGFHLQGYGLKQQGNTVTIDNTKVVNLTVPQQINPAQETNILDLIGNLQSSSTTAQTQSVGVYDSLGQLHNVVLSFTPSGSADGNWSVSATSADLSPGSSVQVGGGNAQSTLIGSAELHFNPLGQLDGTVTPLELTFVGGTTSTVTPDVGTSTGPTQAGQPWVIPGTTTGSNAAQSAVFLNINDPKVGNLTQFASATALSTQASPSTAAIPIGNGSVQVTGNLNSTAKQGMGVASFVAQDSTGATHTFQVGLQGSTGTTFTPTLLSVDGFSGVAQGNLNPSSVSTVVTTVSAFDSTGIAHSFQVDLVPICAPGTGIDGGTTWSAFVASVDGDAGGVPATGNLQSGATTATTLFNFNATEPDGVNHQFAVTLTRNTAGNWTIQNTGDVTVDGATKAGVSVVANTTNIVGGPITISVGVNTPGFENGVAENFNFDFGAVTVTSGSSNVSASVVNPSTVLKFDSSDPPPTGSGKLIAGGSLSIGVNSGALFNGAATASNVEANGAQSFNFNFAQVTNLSTSVATISNSTVGNSTLPASLTNTNLTFSGPGVAPSSGSTQTLTIGADAFGDNNTAETLSLNFSKLQTSTGATGLAGPLYGSAGNSAGSLKDFTVDQTGVLHGVYTNGFTQTIGQILLATFENPAGLERLGSNLLQTSADSGVVNVGTAGSGKFGTIAEGNIETSNVDLAQEFSNMILAERGFQANSRVITTADTMLSDLMGIKQTP